MLTHPMVLERIPSRLTADPCGAPRCARWHEVMTNSNPTTPSPQTPSLPTSRFHSRVTRRVIGALAGLAIAGGLAAGPAAAAAASSVRSTSTVRSASTVGAADFVASLGSDDVEDLQGGYPNVPGTGLRLSDLDDAHQRAAFDLLRSMLSPAAWTELSDLIEADAAIGALDDYYLALFGDPDGDFVLQFSTADLTLSAIRQGGSVDVRPDVVS